MSAGSAAARLARMPARRWAFRSCAAAGAGRGSAHRFRPERRQPVARHHRRPRRARLDRSALRSHARKRRRGRGRPVRRGAPLVRLRRVRHPARGRARAANGACRHRSLRGTRHTRPRSLRRDRPQLPRQRRSPRLRADHRSAPRGGGAGEGGIPSTATCRATRWPGSDPVRRSRPERRSAGSGRIRRTATGLLTSISS